MPYQNRHAVPNKKNERRKIMSDNLAQKGPQDRSRINTHEDWEVKYWSTKFACSAEQLVEAVHAVGNSAAAVEEYLKGKK
jgi:hypothetical protein